MPTNVCLRSKWPNYSSGQSDGAAAFDGTNSLFKPQAAINGGSHDIEGWFPVESGNDFAVNPRVPYTSVSGDTTGNSRVQVRSSDNPNSTWATWDGASGRGLQFQGDGDFTGGSAELHTNPYFGSSAALCKARANQIWSLDFHAYHNQSSARNFSVWVFFLNSSYATINSSFPTFDLGGNMDWSDESSGGSRAYLHPDSGEYGHSSGYNDTNGNRNNCIQSNAGGYNFLMHPLDDTAPTNGDYRFYQVFFKCPNNSNVRFLAWRMDLDSDNQRVQIDEICMRPYNVSLQDCNGGSGTNISLSTVSGN